MKDRYTTYMYYIHIFMNKIRRKNGSWEEGGGRGKLEDGGKVFTSFMIK